MVPHIDLLNGLQPYLSSEPSAQRLKPDLNRFNGSLHVSLASQVFLLLLVRASNHPLQIKCAKSSPRYRDRNVCGVSCLPVLGISRKLGDSRTCGYKIARARGAGTR